MIRENDELITMKELCEMLKICRATAYKLIQTNKLKPYRVGKLNRFRKSEVIEYISSKQVE